MIETSVIENVSAIDDTPFHLIAEIEGLGSILVPKNVISTVSIVQKRGDSGPLTVSRWWARQEGLI